MEDHNKGDSMEKLQVIDWFSYDEVFNIFPKLKQMPIFKTATMYNEAVYDEAHKEAIIKDIIDNNYVIYGDTHQSEDWRGIPVFEDGYIFLSMRSWGELMAAAQNIREGKPKYTYLDFYMAVTGSIPEKLMPNLKI